MNEYVPRICIQSCRDIDYSGWLHELKSPRFQSRSNFDLSSRVCLQFGEHIEDKGHSWEISIITCIS